MTRQVQIRLDRKLFVDTVTTAASGSGLLSEEQAALFKVGGDKTPVAVAAVPKSGGSFLVHTLATLTGLPYFRLCAAYSTNEHDLYLPALLLTSSSGCISHLHMKGTFHNAALAQRFGIRPILLVRRIEDIVVSLQHDLKQKAQLAASAVGAVGYPFIWQDESTKDLSEEQRLDLIIDLTVPWFVSVSVPVEAP